MNGYTRTKSPAEIITFNGEFSDRYLASTLQIAEIIRPFDECTDGSSTEYDTLALMELMEAEDCINYDFIALLVQAACEFNELALLRSKLCSTQSQSLKQTGRITRCLDKILQSLMTHGYRLIWNFLREAVSVSQKLRDLERLKTNGFNQTREEYLGNLKLARIPPDIVRRAIRDFGWHEIAYRAEKAKANPPRIRGSNEAREILKTIELVPSQPGTVVGLRHGLLPMEGVPEYQFYIGPSGHPLNLCSVIIVDTNDGRVVADCEMNRSNGDLIFSHGCVVPVSLAFRERHKSSMYGHLKDLVAIGLIELIGRGELVERTYSELPDDDDEDSMEEEIEALEPDDPDPELPEGIPTEPADEPLADVTVYTPDVAPEEITVRRPKNGYERIGTSRLRTKRILRAFERYGVEVTKPGRHYKLTLGAASVPFLNLHSKEEDRHYSKALIIRALDKLGLSAEPEDFFASL